MNKFLTWFVVSSANPNEFSMRLKGMLIANIAIIMWLLHLAGVNSNLEQVTDVIGWGTGFIGTAMFAAGALRALWIEGAAIYKKLFSKSVE